MRFFTQKVGFIGIIILLLIPFSSSAFAQELIFQSTPSATVQVSDYQLPYPGLLPDSPLYILKAMRDRVVSWFISDIKKRASFDLLQADKRLAASLVMSQEHPINADLIDQTISKGENYFSEAISQSREAKKAGMEVNGLTDQLANAAEKHAETIKNIANILPKKDSELVLNEYRRVLDFEKQVANIRSH